VADYAMGDEHVRWRERVSNRVVKIMAHTPENLKAVQAIKDREQKHTRQ
jgi:hypothetical protein